MRRRRRSEPLRAAGYEPEPPERQIGVHARAVCVDGPAAKIGVARPVARNEVVVLTVLVDGEWRRAEYVGAGPCPEVPPADGVGLRFRRLLEEPTEARPGDRLS